MYSSVRLYLTINCDAEAVSKSSQNYIANPNGFWYIQEGERMDIIAKQLQDPYSEDVNFLLDIVNARPFHAHVNVSLRNDKKISGRTDAISIINNFISKLNGLILNLKDHKVQISSCFATTHSIDRYEDYDSYCRNYEVKTIYFDVNCTACLLEPVKPSEEKSLKLRYRNAKRVKSNNIGELLLAGANYDKLAFSMSSQSDTALASLKGQDTDKVNIDSIRNWIKNSYYFIPQYLGSLYVCLRDTTVIKHGCLYPEFDKRGITSKEKMEASLAKLKETQEAYRVAIEDREALDKDFAEYLEAMTKDGKKPKTSDVLKIDYFMAITLYENIKVNPLGVKLNLGSSNLLTSPVKEIVEGMMADIDSDIIDDSEDESDIPEQ